MVSNSAAARTLLCAAKTKMTSSNQNAAMTEKHAATEIAAAKTLLCAATCWDSFYYLQHTKTVCYIAYAIACMGTIGHTITTIHFSQSKQIKALITSGGKINVYLT